MRVTRVKCELERPTIVNSGALVTGCGPFGTSEVCALHTETLLVRPHWEQTFGGLRHSTRCANTGRLDSRVATSHCVQCEHGSCRTLRLETAPSRVYHRRYLPCLAR